MSRRRKYSKGLRPNHELRYKDEQWAINVGDGIHAVGNKGLCIVPRGNGVNERSGNRIIIKSVEILGEIEIDWNANQSNDVWLKLYLVQDTCNNGSSENPSPGLIWFTPGKPDLPDYHSLRHMDHQNRFKIIGEKAIHLKRPYNLMKLDDPEVVAPSSGVSQIQGPTKASLGTLKMTNRDVWVKYMGNTSENNSILSSNNLLLYVACLGHQKVGSEDDSLKLKCYSRIRFVD